MKLAFTTLGCPDWSFSHIVEEGGRLGFDALEIRGIEGVMRAEEMPRLSPEGLPATQRELERHGLDICAFGSSVAFHDEARYEAFLEEGRQAIDVCAAAGIPMLRVFGDKIEKEEDRGRVLDRVCGGFRELCEYAGERGVDVLLEIHGDFNRLETVLPVAERLESLPAFGILWDIEHTDKVYGDSWTEFYRPLRHLIRHTHIKDHVREEDGFRLCLIGEGDIPIHDIARTMLADGYDGYFSLEWEKKWQPHLPEPEEALPGYVNYMRALETRAC